MTTTADVSILNHAALSLWKAPVHKGFRVAIMRWRGHQPGTRKKGRFCAETPGRRPAGSSICRSIVIGTPRRTAKDHPAVVRHAPEGGGHLMPLDESSSALRHDAWRLSTPASSVSRVIRIGWRGGRFRLATTKGRNTVFTRAAYPSRTVPLAAMRCATRISESWPAVCLCLACGASARNAATASTAFAGRRFEHGELFHASCSSARDTAPERRSRRLRRRPRAVPLQTTGGSRSTCSKVHACLCRAPAPGAQPTGRTRRSRSLAVPCLRHLRTAALKLHPPRKPVVFVSNPEGLPNGRRMSCNV